MHEYGLRSIDQVRVRLSEYDVVVVADVRETSDDVLSVAQALDRWAAHGFKVGISQLCRNATDRVVPLAVDIRQRLDRGHAELVLPDEQGTAGTVVIWKACQLLSAALPTLTAKRVVVVYGGPARGMSTNGDDLRLFGLRPEWRTAPPGLDEMTRVTAYRSSDGRTAHRHMSDVDKQTVLMVSSNGTGMGHLTRLLAYARKAPSNVRPHFLSLSQAVSVVGEFDFPYEYVASVAANGMSPGRWRAYFASRLGEAIDRLQPRVVVFDGAWAYESIVDVKARFPGVRWVWSRRGMWYRGMNRDQLSKSAWFDTVVEPGDFSSPADRGATVNEPAVRVGPVTLLDDDELLARADARKALELDQSAPTALVTLGAGNINDTTSAIRVVIDALRSLGVEICVTVPAIAERASTDDVHVRAVTTYPLARYLRAFDVAVSASGYNSFHELLRFGVPTLFLPNLNTSLDDQRSRAAYAAEQGWAYSLDRAGSPAHLQKPLEALLEHGHEMVAKVTEVDPGNGADRAMELIVSHIRDVV